MSGGWGTGWGGSPWGGSAATQIAAAPQFDVFCFQDVSMFQILSDPNITTVTAAGPPTPLSVDATELDLTVCSGGAYPTNNARVIMTANIPDSFTVEWVVRLREMPNDFSNIVNNHVYLGAYDAAGPLVGLFFSNVGVAYTGSVSFPGGNLQLDTTFQVLPGSADWITDSEFVVVRVAASTALGFLYLYITPLSELGVTGQQLRAILPIIPYDAAAVAPTDQSLVSVRGTATSEVCIDLSSWCLGNSLIIPNLAPIAMTGLDQAVRMCSVIQLDGTQSFDPEGSPLLYYWRLIDAPLGSEFTEELGDGRTYPEAIPTGYTDKFYSPSAGAIDALDAFAVGSTGDVLLVDGVAHTVVAKGTDGTGFYLQIGDDVLADSLINEQFKIVRQRGVSGIAAAKPTFYPDVAGFFTFDLTVFDGSLYSSPAITVVNVLESALPRGCTPDLSFIFNYLSSFWSLVEDKDRIETLWSGMAQVAATELFTAWQVDYSKSHRDIQRTFNRRWLHYDLLLGEPIPELTKLRVLWGGADTAYFASAGISANGTTLVVSSPLFTTQTITITSADPVTATALANELQTKLRLIDSRFSTEVLTNRTSTEQAVRIKASFPFTVSGNSTLSVAVTGTTSQHPTGTGNGVGGNTYKVNKPLGGFNIQEDDFLVLDGVAYRIARVIDDPGDTYAYQRVVVKEDLPVAPSTTWAIAGWVSSELLDFYNGLVDAGDYVDFEASDVTAELAPVSAAYELVSATCLGVNANQPGRLAVNFWNVGAAIADEAQAVYLARVVRRHYVPVHADVLDVPVLQEKIVIEDEEASLRRNVDYYIEEVRNGKGIRFACGKVGDAGDVWQGARPPDRLWAEYTYFDNSSVIEANFGIPVDLTVDQLEELPDTVDYLSAVRGLWYAFFNGASVRNIRIGAQILLGLPFAEAEGVIEEIRTDFSPKFGRMLVRDTANTEIVRVYRWPSVLDLELNPVTGLAYAVGDTVAEFAPLVEGVEVLDYINSPRWFEGILNQGVFFEVEKFHKFMVRVDSAAFNLSALSFVRNFVLKIKPTYTYPLFIIQKEVGESEVSTTDVVTMNVCLTLSDAACSGLKGASFHLDQPRPAGGGYRNQLDSDLDPDNALPTFPTPQSVGWGLDKAYFCGPSTELVGACTQTFGAPFTPTLDSVFVLDTPPKTRYNFTSTSPASIPAGPAGLTVGSTATAAMDGTITKLRFYALGDLDGDPGDYEVAIDINSTEEDSIVFTAVLNSEIYVDVSIPVSAADDIDVRIRPASGGARTPNWSKVFASLVQEGTDVWTLDDTLAAGVYTKEAVL